jgi:hypothetical protein
VVGNADERPVAVAVADLVTLIREVIHHTNRRHRRP